jgi:hypothetical protein
MYIWDEYGYLMWVKDEELESITSMKDKVEFVLCGLGCLEVEPVYRDYHPPRTSITSRTLGRGFGVPHLML